MHAVRAPRRCRPLLLSLLSLVALLAGCTSLVRPPADVEQPATVFLLGEGIHLGLVLPAGPQPGAGFVEYGFGEWSWFAAGSTAWYRAVPAMLWPTQATLAQRHHAVTDGVALRRHADRHGLRLQALCVEADRVQQLHARLGALFDAGRPRMVSQPAWDMHFVPLDAAGRYWLGNTCADVVAGWLRELGCGVTPALIRGDLRVRPQ